MTTTEKLQRIRARCVELINKHNGSDFEAALQAEAGWRSTIVAIDAMSYFVAACESGNARSKTNYAKQKAALDAIIAAWPEELL